MNTDIRISVSFKNHRKRLKLKRLLGESSTDYLLDLWISTAMNHPSGILVGMDALDIALESGWEGDEELFVNSLITCGFMVRMENGEYALHDWEKHQGYVIHAEARSEKARGAASKRWEKNNATSMPQACNKHAPSMPVALLNTDFSNAPSPEPVPDPAPSPEPVPVPSPLPTPKPSKEDKVQEIDTCPNHTENGEFNLSLNETKKEDSCPYKKIVEIFHECVPNNPRVRSLGEPLKKLIRARWKEDKEQQSLEWWRIFFTEYVETSDWLTGRGGKSSPYALNSILTAKSFSVTMNGGHRNKGYKQSAHVLASKKSPSEIMSEFHAQFAKSDKDAITVEATVIENNKLTG